MPPETDVTMASRDPSVCLSVTLMRPAEAIEMPFGRDTHGPK